MSHRTASEGHRVLIAAPFGNDAAYVATILRAQGYDAVSCWNLDEVAQRIDEHTGVILMTEEALADGSDPLREAIQQQEPWSDVPFVLLASNRSRYASGERARLPAYISNAMVLERPLGTASLISALASAMRSRQKQFQIRDQLSNLARARRELAVSEERLRLATEAAEIGLWEVDPLNDTLYWAPHVRAMFGIGDDRDVTMQDFYAGLHPDDVDRVSEAFASAADPDRRTTYDVEYRTVGRNDGAVRWVAAKGRGHFDDQGRCTRIIGTAVNITPRKTAELALLRLNETLEERVEARTQELMKAEAALRQSQKMEAVGQLTGGIAHDFNNMLTGIIGSLDLLKRRLAEGRSEGLTRYLQTAEQSAYRAAKLTDRLLAFSRRQSLDIKPVDVSELVSSLGELLLSTVRENIALEIVPSEEKAIALADASQLENAIINLAVNARDAMPDGGRLIVRTHCCTALPAAVAGAGSDLEPGRYIILSVSDTGVGIAPEIIDRVFDPFFTTKDIGQGTGLGLSMVYGFAKQSGGHVFVESAVGRGTTISIYLPASDTVSHPAVDAPPDAVEAAHGNGQTVLFVEDDPSVRLLIREVLEELSYTAIEAKEAAAAIEILKSDRRVDLIISDVGLPGMNGRQFGDVARQYRPHIPILFVTGYAQEAAVRADFLGKHMAMITKPFAMDVLGRKVSEMIALPDTAGTCS